jgi:AraC-like DNA-binding protein
VDRTRSRLNRGVTRVGNVNIGRMPPISDVATLLKPPALLRFRLACGPSTTVHVADSSTELEAIVRGHLVAFAIVDPVRAEVHRVRRLGCPVVAYTDVTAESIRALVALATPHVVIQGVDDNAVRFRKILSKVIVTAPADELLVRLAPKLAGMPQSMTAALVTLFRAPHRVRTARALSRLCGCPPRTLSRRCERAGLASPLRLTVAAHVFNAYHQLQTGDSRVAEVAQRVGYSPDTLARVTSAVTGRHPRELARDVNPHRLVDNLMAFMTTR